MLGSRWIIAVALVLTVCLSARAQDSGPEPTAKPTQAQEQPAEQPTVEPSIVADVPPTEPASDSHNGDDSTHAGEQEKQGHYWAGWLLLGDGMAQWLMAIFGVVAVGLSAWAVFLIKATLDATKAAVTEAETATDAAQRSVAVTERMGQLQVRAYLTVAEIRMERVQAGARPMMVLKILNTGQSPAYDCKIKSICILSGGNPHRLPVRFPPTEEGGGSKTDTGSGQPIFQYIESDDVLSPGQEAAIANGTAVYVAAGVINYRDVFRKNHRLVFRLWSARPEPNSAIIRFNPSSRNNRSN